MHMLEQSGAVEGDVGVWCVFFQFLLAPLRDAVTARQQRHLQSLKISFVRFGEHDRSDRAYRFRQVLVRDRSSRFGPCCPVLLSESSDWEVHRCQQRALSYRKNG